MFLHTQVALLLNFCTILWDFYLQLDYLDLIIVARIIAVH